DQHLTAPAAPQEAEGARRLLGDPADYQGHPEGAEADGSAAGPTEQGLDAAVPEATLPAVDGAAGAEQHGGDGGPGEAVGQEQDDVGAEAQLRVGGGAVAVQEG